MSHMVIYRGADGKPGFQQIDDLATAIAYVEKLRNEQSVENSRIYRLEQVQYRFEPYFQVRLDDGSTVSSPAVSSPAPVVEVAPAKEPVVEAVRPAAPTPPAPPSLPTPPAPPAAVRTPVTASVSAPVASAANAAENAGDATAAEAGDAANGIRRGLFGR